MKDPSPDPVGRAFTSAVVELALGSYPGFTMTAPPAAATPFGIYRAAYVDRADVTHTVVHADGTREVVADPGLGVPQGEAPGARPSPYPGRTDVLTRRLPLGTFVHARSGDKGGDANVGLWVAHDGVDAETYDARVQWLFKLMSPRGIPALLPEADGLDVEVWLLPHLGAVNLVVHGLLGDGRRRLDALRPAGQGARRVAAVAAGLDRGEPAYRPAGARRPAGDGGGVRAPRGRAAPAGVGGRGRDPARAAPHAPATSG